MIRLRPQHWAFSCAILWPAPHPSSLGAYAPPGLDLLNVIRRGVGGLGGCGGWATVREQGWWLLWYRANRERFEGRLYYQRLRRRPAHVLQLICVKHRWRWGSATSKFATYREGQKHSRRNGWSGPIHRVQGGEVRRCMRRPPHEHAS